MRKYLPVPIQVPFNSPALVGREKRYLDDVLERRDLSSNGSYTQQCHAWLRERLGVREALLTHSCTAALEMSMLLAELEPGDEVILPSYTFVSTANAVVLRGAVPVFVDIRPDTLNIDETKIQEAITPRTKALVAVHYAGVCANMDAINAVARAHDLVVIEDAAQALLSTYRDRPAGQLGDVACFSFHATKNVISGEGGALVTNHSKFAERAHIIWEKGTNRRQFLQGRVDKYTWVDIGSSFLPSELTAAFLLAQLEESDSISAARLQVWNFYHEAFADLEVHGNGLRRPMVPSDCRHNGHLYYLLMPDKTARDNMMEALAAEGIAAPFHYIPLHSSPAGRRFGRPHGSLAITNDLSGRLLRLPLYAEIGNLAEIVADRVRSLWKSLSRGA